MIEVLVLCRLLSIKTAIYLVKREAALDLRDMNSLHLHHTDVFILSSLTGSR